MRYNVCIFIHKMKKGILPDYLKEEIKLVGKTHTYNTRQRNNIKIKRCRTKGGQSSITYSGFEMYNILPEEIRKQENIKAFKVKLREHVKTITYEQEQRG